MPRNLIGPGGTALVEFDPRAAGPDVRPVRLVEPPHVQILPGTAFKPEAVRWIWNGWLAYEKFHLMAGAAGTGKTTLCLSIAAIITRGGQWPDGSIADLGDVLVWSGEDGVSDTLLPRVLAAGGDIARVHFVKETTEQGRPRPFDPSTDMPRLVEVARQLPALKLVILDPVVAAVSGDSHKNTETRRGLQPVVDMAEALNCVVIGITHFSKSTSGREPLERVAGSLAFGAVARVVLATVKPADADAPRRLVRAKSNLGPDSGGFEYVLFGAPVPGHDFIAQRVDWGAPLEGTARELLMVEQPDTDGRATDTAETFLLDALREGPVATRELKQAAAAHGHRWRTVERAKDRLHVVAVKSGFATGWAWQLPTPNTANTHEDRQQD